MVLLIFFFSGQAGRLGFFFSLSVFTLGLEGNFCLAYWALGELRRRLDCADPDRSSISYLRCGHPIGARHNDLPCQRAGPQQDPSFLLLIIFLIFLHFLAGWLGLGQDKKAVGWLCLGWFWQGVLRLCFSTFWISAGSMVFWVGFLVGVDDAHEVWAWEC
jgi:hypothetical protein